MFVIKLLIIIFSLLIFYEIYLAFNKKQIEGLENESYQDYNISDSSTDAMILAQQNAGNIAFLKQQVDDLLSLKSSVEDLTSEVDTMSTQINDLAQQQADYATSLVGDSTVDVTGTTYETT